ncbi:MAG TPA: fasciclin domain-containing protein [Pyrinomonadaceae bacterium]|nr:fasciclin domain-containing protein [Pyrinomonadaceae bacterium]
MKKVFLSLVGMLVLAPLMVFAQNGMMKSEAKMETKNIAETAASAGMFNTLLAAAKAAGLDGVLATDGPFTVFAPTDEAFAKLPAGTVENLLKPENKDMLVKVLKYHLVSGNVMAADVVKLKKAKTVQGQEVKIKVKDGKVWVDKANVVKTDIAASNGVIHVIDMVLMPK